MTMDSSACHYLDDYLAHDLRGDDEARFVEHLTGCPACQQAIDEHERLAALLREASRELEPIPVCLTERIARRLRATRRRRAVALVAAALVAMTAMWLFTREGHRLERQPIVAEPGPEPRVVEAPRPVERVRVTFPDDAHVIAMPVKMDSPNVTFIWVYPGLREPSQSAADGNDSSSSPERNGS
jgi:anti-sigma factor RsiW